MSPALRLLLDPAQFVVRQLYRMGQIGWHWQFDNPLTRVGIAYEWTDTAGTTLVTAVGQGIGLLLGREYGGATGPSLLANGATGLTGAATAASYSTTTFAGSVSRAGDASNQSWVTWTGLTTSSVHRIRITNSGATSLDVRNGGVAGTIVASVAAGASTWVHPATTGGSTSITITATTNSTTATFTLGQFAVLPGTHLTQATGTAKPTLSARVNAFIASEDPANANWAKTECTAASGGLITGSVNTGVVRKVGQSITTGTMSYKQVFRVKMGTQRFVQCYMPNDGTPCFNFDLQLGTMATIGGSGGFITADPDGYYNIGMTYAGAGGTAQMGTLQFVDSLAAARNATHSTGSTTLYLARADLRTADDAAKNIPAYQRVGATAADHDTDGFPHGVYPDGTDDSGTTAVGGGNTTGFFYCGALTVSGGAGAARTIWSDTGTNTGYRVRINASNKLELAAGNGSAYTTVQSNETITAPGTYLLSAWDDGGVLAVQVNNLAPATTTRPTVSAGTAVITVYKDNGAASSYFNGRDYGSVYRQQYPGETAHNRIKRYLANVARITV